MEIKITQNDKNVTSKIDDAVVVDFDVTDVDAMAHILGYADYYDLHCSEGGTEDGTPLNFVKKEYEENE